MFALQLENNVSRYIPDMRWTPFVAEFCRRHPYLVGFNAIFLVLVPVNDLALPHLFGRVTQAFQENQPVTSLFIHLVILLVITRLGSLLLEVHDAKFTTTLESFVRDRAVETLFLRHETTQEGLRPAEVVAKLNKL